MPEPPLAPQLVLGLTPQQLPRHIAIIMDGNGRWAKQRDLPRIAGHERGAQSVRTIVTHCARLGIEALTLYSFSSENWKRPKEEVDFLMELYARYLVLERDTIMDNNVRFLHIGRREGLPKSVLNEMDRTIEMSRTNSGLALCLALNYGSRDEIVDGIRSIARNVQDGRLAPDDIDESTITEALYTSGLPDPDLLIRTANERRVSNFLLWQISYAEIHVCAQLWPDFGLEDLNAAIKDFAGRERRYGDVTTTAANQSG
jgi:undecaprenyl diphosphate synthase